MFFVRVFSLLLVVQLTACGGGVADDLLPSGEDKRTDVVPGSVGTQPGQQSPDFIITDTLNTTYTLSTELIGADAVVLYFTMWCPVCDSHSTHMRATIIPDFPNVRFYLVDYVSGSIAVARSAQLSNGYASSTVLVDVNQHLFALYNASMGTTVVIASNGIVQMNEDYKDGVKLRQALVALP